MNWRRLSVMRPRAWMASRRGWRHRLYIFLAGALSALAMAPLHIWPALMIGLCLLVWSLDGARRTARPDASAFLRGLLFGMGYFLAGTFWIAFAFITRGPGYSALVPIVMPLFAAMLAVFWGLAGIVYTRLAQRSEWRVLVFAAAFTLLEGVRGHLFGGLPWNLPGYTWAAGGTVSQAASWAGIYGLSFLTLFVLASPAVVIGRRTGTRRFLPVMSAAAIGLLLICFGALRLASMPEGERADVRMRIVQAAITQQEKWAADGEAITRDRYISLTAAPGLENVTHVLWPEGALPIFMLEDGDTLARIAAELDEGQILIAGVNQRARNGTGYAYYNALAAMRFPGGSPRLEALYQKVRLTPFGEMVPMTWLLERIGFAEFTRYQFSPGPAPSVLQFTGAPPVMPLICYEAIFPGFVRAMPERPEWLLNISNDAWFGATFGPQQHFNQSRYRSIEAGLPMVRSAARGWSGTVDAAGRAVVTIAPDTEGAFDVSLPAALDRTPYMIWGDAPVWMLVVLVLAGVGAQRWRARRGRFIAHS